MAILDEVFTSKVCSQARGTFSECFQSASFDKITIEPHLLRLAMVLFIVWERSSRGRDTLVTSKHVTCSSVDYNQCTSCSIRNGLMLLSLGDKILQCLMLDLFSFPFQKDKEVAKTKKKHRFVSHT